MKQLLEKRITKDSPYIRSFLGLNSDGEPKVIIAYKSGVFEDHTVFSEFGMMSGFDYLESLGYDYSSAPFRDDIISHIISKGYSEVIV